MQEERQQLDKPGPAPVSRTPSPSPSVHSNPTEDIRASTPSQQGVQLAVITESLQLGAMSMLTTHIQMQAGRSNTPPIINPITGSPMTATQITAFHALADPANNPFGRGGGPPGGPPGGRNGGGGW